MISSYKGGWWILPNSLARRERNWALIHTKQILLWLLFVVLLLDILHVHIREKNTVSGCLKEIEALPSWLPLYQFFQKTLVLIPTVAELSWAGELMCGPCCLFQKEMKATFVWQSPCVDFFLLDVNFTVAKTQINVLLWFFFNVLRVHLQSETVWYLSCLYYWMN